MWPGWALSPCSQEPFALGVCRLQVQPAGVPSGASVRLCSAGVLACAVRGRSARLCLYCVRVAILIACADCRLCHCGETRCETHRVNSVYLVAIPSMLPDTYVSLVPLCPFSCQSGMISGNQVKPGLPEIDVNCRKSGYSGNVKHPAGCFRKSKASERPFARNSVFSVIVVIQDILMISMTYNAVLCNYVISLLNFMFYAIFFTRKPLVNT